MEAPLELRARVDQMMRRRFEMRMPRQASGKICQSDANAVDVAIGENPMTNVRVDDGEPTRQRLTIHCCKDAGNEIIQPFG